MADKRFRARLLRQVLIAGACGLVLCASGMSAYAGDDEDEDTFEQRIIKSILGGMGVDVGRPGIDYRERSPLVVPPSRDLPPPQASVTNSPAWPQERKKQAAVKVKPLTRATMEDPGTSAPLTPDEMRRGATTKSTRITDPSQSGSEEEPNIGRPLTQKELGGKSLTWGSLFSYTPEKAPFTGEPQRSELTQPPPGYQTPSAQAPYGIGQDTPSGWKIPTILSRPEGSPDN